jgi:hypothetical protein
MAERDPDALGWRTLIGFCAAAAALVVLSAPVLLLLLAPAQRAVMLRVLVALYAAGALPRLLTALGVVVAPGGAGRLGRLLRPPPPPVLPDPALARLAAQLHALGRMPPHLRPRRTGRPSPLLARLRAIAARRHGAALPAEAPPLSERAELDRLLTRIEDAP